MPEGRKSYTEFAQAIKAKYPDYKDVDDFELASKMVQKYPEYADQVDLVKKKSVAGPSPSTSNPAVVNTSAPSVLAGGTSGLTATPSASAGQFDLPGRVNPFTLAPVGEQPSVPYTPAKVQPLSKEEQEYEKQIIDLEGKQKLSIPTEDEIFGKKIDQPSSYTTFSPLGKRRSTPISTTTKTDNSNIPYLNSLTMSDNDQRGAIQYLNDKKEEELKDVADFYDKDFLPKRAAMNLPISDKHSTVDFYMEYLKAKNPDEYNYTQEKLTSLRGTVEKDKKTGEDKEDTSEDQLALERYQAELQSKAFELKTKAFKAKYQMAENNINNYYKDKVSEFNTLNSDIQKDYDQLASIQAQIDKLPKNEQGQVIPNASNRKETEALLAKRNELATSFEQKRKRQDEIKQDQDFMDATQLMSDVQKNYNDLSSQYYDLATKNPEAFKDLPEYKKLIEQKAKKQKEKDFVEGKVTDFGVGESVSRAITNTLSKLSYIPKSLTSNSEYGWTDKLYDITKSNIDDFNDEYITAPTGLDKPLLEDGNWNLKYLPGKVAGTATDMAIMIALTKGTGEIAAPALSGEAASSMGSVVSGYVMSASGYYDEAKEAGMSEREAVNFSRSLATQQALLELVSPNEKLITPGKIKGDIAEFSKKVASGATRKEALLETTKEIIKKTVPEVAQENLQLLDEVANKYASKELSGELSSARQSLGEQMIETSIITALTTLGISGKSSIKTRSSLDKQSLYMAAYAPDKVIGSLESMIKSGQISDQKAADVMQNITIASEALKKMDQNIPVEKQIDILPEMINKMIKEQEEKSVDSNFKSIKKEEVASIDERIQNALNGIPDVDDNDILDGLEEEILNEKQQKDEKVKKTNEAEVLTTDEDNKMQQEGLTEVDSTEARKPVELSVETPAKEESAPIEMKVSLPAQIKGGLERNMVFDNGEWKQSIGGELSKVSKQVQEQADKAFNDTHKYENEKEVASTEENNVNPEIKPEERKTMRVAGQDFYVEVNDKNVAKYTSVKTGAELPIQSDKYDALEGMRNKKPTEKVSEEEAVEEQPQKQAATKQELSEEESDDTKKEDPASLQKINDDLEVMKKMSEKDKVEKKFKGMIERAYKMRNEDKISRSTYTEYKRKAAQVLGGKFDLDKEEAKIKAEQFFEDVKKKILGDGTKMNKAFSAPGVTPKVVSDLIDLTSKATVLVIDKGGYDLAKAVKKAVAYIKVKNPKYQKLVDAGIIDEDTFEKEVEATLKKEEETPKTPSVDKEKKPSAEKEKSEPEKKSTQETEESKPGEQNKSTESVDFSDGEKKKKKSIARIEDDPEFKKLRGSVSEEDVMYNVTKKKKVAEYVSKKLDQFQKEGSLVELATDMANGKSIFPDIVNGVAYGFMAKRIAELSEREGINPAEADMLMSIAGKLYTKFTDFGYNAGVQASLQDVVNKELGTVSSSEALTREAVHQKVKSIQEETLTEKEKSQIKSANEEIQAEWSQNLQKAVNEKIAEISKSVLGEEKSNKAASLFASLKNDLKDC